MQSFVLLLRGINVGGKNKVPMADFKNHLELAGFNNVVTYIQSGNAVIGSSLSAKEVSEKVEAILETNFALDSKVRVLAIEHESYRKVVSEAPAEFQSPSDEYRYDVIFLIDRDAEAAFEETPVKEGLDKKWLGDEVIYYRRPSQTNPDYTKTNASRMIQKPVYQNMTVRNWNTTVKMLELLDSDKS